LWLCELSLHACHVYCLTFHNNAGERSVFIIEMSRLRHAGMHGHIELIIPETYTGGVDLIVEDTAIQQYTEYSLSKWQMDGYNLLLLIIAYRQLN
jgi:hypothetical protein